MNLKHILIGLLVVGSVLAAGAGLAAAEETEFVIEEQTVEADDNLEAIWADVVGADEMGGADADARVIVKGIEHVEGGDDTETELSNEVLTVQPGGVESSQYDLADADSDTYDEISIVVEVETGSLSDFDTDESEWGTLEQNIGGGGGLLDDAAGLGIGGVVAIVVIGYVLVGRD